MIEHECSKRETIYLFNIFFFYIKNQKFLFVDWLSVPCLGDNIRSTYTWAGIYNFSLLRTTFKKFLEIRILSAAKKNCKYQPCCVRVKGKWPKNGETYSAE